MIEHCPEQLPLTQEVVSFLADACTIMETDMTKVGAREGMSRRRLGSMLDVGGFGGLAAWL